jgi:predicted RND superfamily exporter protein
MSEGARRPLSRAGALLVVLVSLVAAWLVAAQLRLEPNIAALLPDAGEAAALRRYVGAFGGTDLGLVLVRGDSPDSVEHAARAVAEGLRAQPSVLAAADRVPLGSGLAPLLAFRHADLAGQARLRQLLTPEGMRARLAETRRLLLGPGSGALVETLAADPLRLVQAAFEGREGSGFATQADGSFATDDGHARLVLVEPRGKALVSADAKAFVADAERVLEDVRAAHPGVTLGLTGGHAIAASTEAMLRRDFAISGTLSMVLASLAFLLTFRRLRALGAVMPPLALGSLWTAAVASILPGGLSAIAIAFMSVVVGVGVDTGVHVYAALLEGRRDGLSSNDAALAARRRMARPVLLAAATAAAAFAALGLSEIGAVRQLGLLCAAGELLTAVAILVVTPALGALLERGPVAARPEPAWTRRVAELTSTRGRALLVALFALAPLALVALGAGPSFSPSVVAIRPAGMAPLEVQSQVFAAFGGAEGQWVVLVADTEQESARTRADRLAERLAAAPELVRSVDALTTLAPAESTQRQRLEGRDSLGLPARADELERALTETGFAASRFSAALAAFREPPHEHVSLDDVRRGGAGILLGRYLGEDAGEKLVALYVQPQPGEAPAEALVALIHDVEPGALVTGYARLESALRASLVRDLPRIGGAAALLVLGVLIVSLRRPRDVALAALVVAVEIAAVLLAVRFTGVPLHAYSALVIPVLVGITVDEGVFLLHRVHEAGGEDVAREALAHEGPIVAATGLTTAAGFGALALCDFDGLRHLGIVGALGSAMGLAIALFVVPAGVRLFPRKKA